MEVEFIGAPGAGKSTIISELSKHIHITQTYGISPYRVALQETEKYRKLFQILPEHVQEILIDRYLKYRLLSEYFDHFVSDNPKFSQIFINALGEMEQDREKIFGRWRRSVARYMMSVSSDEDTIICFDEGIYQQVFGIRWHSAFQWDPKEYLMSAPNPSLVVLVEAPWEVCLKRQKSRGSITVDKRWVPDIESHQRELNATSAVVYDILSETDIPIISIDNTQPLEKSTERILNVIEKHC